MGYRLFTVTEAHEAPKTLLADSEEMAVEFYYNDPLFADWSDEDKMFHTLNHLHVEEAADD